MKRYKYIQLPVALLPKDIVEKYKLTTVAKDEWVYTKIRRGCTDWSSMYELKINTWPRTLNHMYTINAGTHMACGAISGGSSRSS